MCPPMFMGLIFVRRFGTIRREGLAGVLHTEASANGEYFSRMQTAGSSRTVRLTLLE